MSIRTHPVFAAVVEAMQSAEELGGCEVEDYAPLMQAVEAEARTRRRVFLAMQSETRAARFTCTDGGRVRLLAFLVAVGWLAVVGAVVLVRAFLEWIGGAS